MPSKSKKQHNFMEAIAHSPEFAKKAGVPQSVGKDFAEADKGKKFRKGGTTNPKMSAINKQQTHHGKLQMPNVSLNKYVGMKEGGMALFKGKETYGEELKEAKAVKSGKITPTQFAKGEKSEGYGHEEKGAKALGQRIKSGKVTPERYAEMETKESKGMKKGGKCMATGGYVRAADGVVQRGKTRGKMV